MNSLAGSAPIASALDAKPPDIRAGLLAAFEKIVRGIPGTHEERRLVRSFICETEEELCLVKGARVLSPALISCFRPECSHLVGKLDQFLGMRSVLESSLYHQKDAYHVIARLEAWLLLARYLHQMSMTRQANGHPVCLTGPRAAA